MDEEKRDIKREQEDKIRCANFLLQMFEKYGAEVRRKQILKEKDSGRA